MNNETGAACGVGPEGNFLGTCLECGGGHGGMSSYWLIRLCSEHAIRIRPM